MILATHAIVGGALATLLPDRPWAPYLAALLGFVSHFVIDAIPHWDYPIRSASVKPNNQTALRFDAALLYDLALIGGDALVGLAAALLLFGSSTTAVTVLLGAAAAILPDPLQFLHSRMPREPLNSLQRFHVWIHTDRRLTDQVTLGVVSQSLFVGAVIAATVCIHRGLLGASGAAGWGLV
jgi:hypothetical protein